MIILAWIISACGLFLLAMLAMQSLGMRCPFDPETPLERDVREGRRKLVSEAEYAEIKADWQRRNAVEIAAGGRPLKPEPPPNMVRREGMFYVGDFYYVIDCKPTEEVKS